VREQRICVPDIPAQSVIFSLFMANFYCMICNVILTNQNEMLSLKYLSNFTKTFEFMINENKIVHLYSLYKTYQAISFGATTHNVFHVLTHAPTYPFLPVFHVLILLSLSNQIEKKPFILLADISY